MKLIAFHPDARDELLEAAARYDEQASGLGTQFIDEVERAVRFLEEHSDLGLSLGKSDNLRRWTLQRFPYSMIYRVDSEILYIVGNSPPTPAPRILERSYLTIFAH